jgi:GntR family transcriptional regulator/MocR family aminotransferase
MRAIYQNRRDTLVSENGKHLGDLLTIVNADAGMHLTARLPAGFDDVEVVRLARARDISAIALSTCYMANIGDPGLVLGFGGVPEADIIRDVVRSPDGIHRRCARFLVPEEAGSLRQVAAVEYLIL